MMVCIIFVIIKILGILSEDVFLIGKCMLLIVLNLFDMLLVSFIRVCFVLCLKIGIKFFVWK